MGKGRKDVLENAAGQEAGNEEKAAGINEKMAETNEEISEGTEEANEKAEKINEKPIIEEQSSVKKQRKKDVPGKFVKFRKPLPVIGGVAAVILLIIGIVWVVRIYQQEYGTVLVKEIYDEYDVDQKTTLYRDTTEYYYDDQGRLTGGFYHTSYGDGHMRKLSMLYDEEGRLIVEQKEQVLDRGYEYRYYEYDEKGRVVESSSEHGRYWDPTVIWKYSYDENDRLVYRDTVLSRGEFMVSRQIRYQYDGDRLIEEGDYIDGELLGYVQYEYKDGLKVKEALYGTSVRTKTEEYIGRYDTPFLFSWKNGEYEIKSPKLQRYTCYTYNKSGMPVKAFLYDAEGRLTGCIKYYYH